MMDINKKIPKYIQICIRRMFWHRQVVKNNTRIVEEWMTINKIDKTIPLQNLIETYNIKAKRKFVAKGQMTIFDYIKE